MRVEDGVWRGVPYGVVLVSQNGMAAFFLGRDEFIIIAPDDVVAARRHRIERIYLSATAWKPEHAPEA